MPRGVPAPDAVCERCSLLAREHEYSRSVRARLCVDGAAFASTKKRASKTTSAGQSFTLAQARLLEAIMSALPSQPNMRAFVRNEAFPALARKASTLVASAESRVRAAQLERAAERERAA